MNAVDISGPVVVQGSPLPVFRGRSNSGLFCASCGQVLVDGYEPRKLIDLGIACFQCNTVTRTALWPSNEALPHNLVTMGDQGRYLVKGTVDQSSDVTLISDQEIQRIRQLIGVAEARAGPIVLSLDGLRMLETEMNILSDNAMARALGDTRKAFAKGNKQFTKYPPAWAIVHLERQITKGHIDVSGIDGMALAYLQWLRHSSTRWRHHPLFALVARGLVHEFHHSMTLLVIASYLSDHGNSISFTNTNAAEGRSPDLYVNIGPTARLSIEVKAPEAFHWPETIPTPAKVTRIVEAQAKAARGQMTGGAGGILVLGAFHRDTTFEPMLTACIKDVLQTKQISKRIAAIATISLTSVELGEDVLDNLTSNAQAAVSIELNPRFAGPNPIRT